MSNSVLVTGASGSIGGAIAFDLAKQGYETVLHYYRSEDKALALKSRIEAIGGVCRLLNFDISNRAECADEITKDMELHGAYYGVVSNAGVTRDNAFPALTDEDWDVVLRTNLDSFYNVLHPAVMPMIRRRQPGRIVVITSVSGIMGNRGQVNYSASKAGIIGAAKSLAIELGKRNITVNCVAPGLIESEMTGDLPVEDLIKLLPIRRLGTCEEVAHLVSFLMSEKASYITRQVISVNGGLC